MEFNHTSELLEPTHVLPAITRQQTCIAGFPLTLTVVEKPMNCLNWVPLFSHGSDYEIRFHYKLIAGARSPNGTLKIPPQRDDS
ncbi:hypothetical protein TNIN_239561 [Trichonephila inaurata madagascariensis]|uniref:Uncharacterized protein n=1 Tax=Trichonephila inaurata madagascariensis TaxID=2747483 RepID=A0A8X7BT07_9ARAC|nr:hypothetical protein TNIN_239561 [Trichonephila inaurata madagascariensis]